MHEAGCMMAALPPEDASAATGLIWQTRSAIEPTMMTQPRASTTELIPAKETVIRFTVDMPESLHRKLSLLAARTGQKKAAIVREMLEEWLRDVED